MEILYSASDIAITRAGGITIYELLYFGIPSLLIPFPYASDNHQLYNALEVKEKYGFFEVLEQKDAYSSKVVDILKILKKLIKKRGEKIKFFAEKQIVEEIKKYMEGKDYVF
jgi:UDP-N-acetylglucosamine--N-acetylmuramyl-(pentapeptide) pyrophosphoryl-undecaprenol N-acetylglucosamine transferase